MTWLRFTFVGLLFAAPGEVLNQILARQNLHAFRSTMISYTVLLLIAYAVGKGLRKIHKSEARALLVFYLLFGTFGLMMEWFALGNAPVLDPMQLITQTGMFTYWGTLVLGPTLLLDSTANSRLKHRFALFFASFSALYLLIALLLPRSKGGIFFGFVIFAASTAALNFYYVKYLRLKRTAQQASVPVAPKPFA